MPELSALLDRAAAGAWGELDLDDVAARATRIRRHRHRAQAAVAATSVAAVALVASLVAGGSEPTSLEQVVSSPTPQATVQGSPVPNGPSPASSAAAGGDDTMPTTAPVPTAPAGAAAASGWVVFAGRLSGDDSTPDAVYRIRADGTQLRRLATASAGATPVLSPDGSRVAYAHAGEIWVVSATGGGPRRVTETPTDSASAPAWAPDGRRIAFTARILPGEVTAALYVVGVDGTGQRALSNGASNDLFPTWSPDGRRLAFARGRTAYVINADGSSERALDPAVPVDGPMRWSPDGRLLAFVSSESSGGAEALWTVDVASGRGTRIAASTGGVPAWSPDSRAVAFDADGVAVVELDRRSVRRLTPTDRCPPEGQGDPCESVQDWTTEGHLVLAYQHRTAGDPSAEILTVGVDGSDRRVLARLAGLGTVDWGAA
jgi:TolB protein